MTAAPVLAGDLPAALDRLRALAAPLLPLPPLDEADYADAHLLFEERSDQRPLLVAALGERLARRADRPAMSVLSVGCGDGVLDAAVVAGLPRQQDVRWDGVEPSPQSGRRWRCRMDALPVRATLFETDLAGLPAQPPAYDVVTLVHSLYYVPDVGDALRRAAELVRAGGELLVVQAPQAGLNDLAAALAPPRAGHRQWWSEDTRAALGRTGRPAEHERLTAQLDLADCLDPADARGRAVLDFTVQARLPDALHEAVVGVVRALALPGTTATLEHAVDLWSVTA